MGASESRRPVKDRQVLAGGTSGEEGLRVGLCRGGQVEHVVGSRG